MRLLTIQLLVLLMFTTMNTPSIYGENIQEILESQPVHRIQHENGELFLQRDRQDIEALVGHVGSRMARSTQNVEEETTRWIEYLSRPHPAVATIRQYLLEAASEFGVPVEILAVIAQVESNWTHSGPTIDQGWGIMHLVQNNYADTLGEAASLLNLDQQILKDDPRQNIRGAAALLEHHAGPDRHTFTRFEDWFSAVKYLTGLLTDELQEVQAERYYHILQQGIQSKTIWNEEVNLDPFPEIGIHSRNNGIRSRTQRSTDFPQAQTQLTNCNYTEGRNHSIDTITLHWIGRGTYAGAISWFQNCDADASAHFVIRSSDGETTQIVRVSDTAWHAGAWGYPYNNSRSIGVEHEATIDNPELWNSEAMLNASASLAQHFTNQYSIPREHNFPGIIGHNEMPGTATSCPGNLPWDQWMQYFNGLPIIFDFWRKVDPIHADSQSSNQQPNFDAQYKIKNESSNRMTIQRLALSVHNNNNQHYFDLWRRDTGNARYYDNVVLNPNETFQFDISYGYFRTPGTFKLIAKAKINNEWIELSSQTFTVLPEEAINDNNFNDALETSNMDWRTGGSGNWFRQTSVSHYGGDAAQSGQISHRQESWLQTSVRGPGTLSFYWKVSSEENYDFLRFYIDGNEQEVRISGSVNWQHKQYNIPSGVHTLKWAYTKDGSVDGGSDTAWLDKIVFTERPEQTEGNLGEALDNTNYQWTTDGAVKWFEQSSISYYGDDAAQAGDITHNQTSWIQTNLTGPGTLSFYWKVSSEETYDYLRFYIDGNEQSGSISGDVNWQQKQFRISAGNHNVKWAYTKDGSVDNGSDCAWLDKVIFTNNPPPSGNLGDAVDNNNLNWSTGGTGDWFKQTSVHYYNNDAAQSADIDHNQSSWIKTNVTGPGVISFYWKVSSESEFDFLKFYIDETEQNGRISGNTNWQQKQFQISSGNHTLKWAYTKDHSVDNGSDAAWLDKVIFTPQENSGDSIEEALDISSLNWSTGGNENCIVDTGVFYYGGDSIKSGSITHDQSTWIQTTVTGPGTLSFFWKVSSENNFDFMRFYYDGYEQEGRISGDVSWQEQRWNIPEGTHTLKWAYTKDRSVDRGDDAGWVDKVIFSR